MENRQSKSIEEYFSKAMQMPLAMSLTDVKSLVSAKGVTSPPKKSWWNLNNIFIMTTATILTTTILFYGLNSNSIKETTYVPQKSNFEAKEIVEYIGEEEQQTETFEALVDSHENEIEKKMALIQNDTALLEPIVESGLTEIPDLVNLPNIGRYTTTLKDKFQTRIEAEETIYLDDQIAIETGEEFNSIEDIDLIDSSTKLEGEVNGETKTITKTIDASNLNTLKLTNRNGKIKVETWNKPQVEVTAYFTLETKEPEHAKLGFDDFKVALEAIGDHANISTNWDDLNNCSCNSGSTSTKKGLLKYLYFGSKNNAKTDSGEKFEYEKFKIEYNVKIPARFNVDLSNKYANIELATIEGDADLTIFQGNLKANNVKELTLNSKYGSAEVGDFERGTVETFQGNTTLGNSNELDLVAKYSKMQIGEVKQLTLQGFQTNMTVNGSVKEIEGSWKYGRLDLTGNVEEMKISTFQTPMSAQNINFLNINIKYGKLSAKKIDKLELEESFQAKLDFEEVGELDGHLKYSQIEIGILQKGMDLITFQGRIDVKEVKADFTALNLKTKYTNINLNFAPNAKYDLDAQTTYTKFDIPTEIMNAEHQQGVNGNANHFVGTFNKSNTKAASKVFVDSFQGNLTMK